MPKTKTINRSSITGRIVPEGYAKQHPDTTQKDTVPTGSRKKSPAKKKNK
jgi:hypothetical protein